MSELSTRLKEVRERMALSQTAFGALGGVSKGSQIAYERGRAEPAATYLQKLGEAGVNVGYLLTGQRMVPLDPKDDFYQLISLYARLGDKHRRQVLNLASSLYGFVMLDEIPDDLTARWDEQTQALMRALREGRSPDDDELVPDDVPTPR